MNDSTHRIRFLHSLSVRSERRGGKTQPINKLAEVFGPISTPDTHPSIGTRRQPEKRRGERRLMVKLEGGTENVTRDQEYGDMGCHS